MLYGAVHCAKIYSLSSTISVLPKILMLRSNYLYPLNGNTGLKQDRDVQVKIEYMYMHLDRL